jgi:hypothetical protein
MDMVLFSRAVRREAPVLVLISVKNVGAALAVWTGGGAKERPYVMRTRPVQAQSEARAAIPVGARRGLG